MLLPPQSLFLAPFPGRHSQKGHHSVTSGLCLRDRGAPHAHAGGSHAAAAPPESGCTGWQPCGPSGSKIEAYDHAASDRSRLYTAAAALRAGNAAPGAGASSAWPRDSRRHSAALRAATAAEVPRSSSTSGTPACRAAITRGALPGFRARANTRSCREGQCAFELPQCSWQSSSRLARSSVMILVLSSSFLLGWNAELHRRRGISYNDRQVHEGKHESCLFSKLSSGCSAGMPAGKFICQLPTCLRSRSPSVAACTCLQLFS